MLFVISCLYSAVSLTLVREQSFIRIIYYYYYYHSIISHTLLYASLTETIQNQCNVNS